MKKILLVFPLPPFYSFINIAEKKADIILGTWVNTDKTLNVEVFRNGVEYKARVV